MNRKTKPERLYYLPEGAMTVEEATLATLDQLKAGERLYRVIRGKFTVEALEKVTGAKIR